MEVCRGMYRSEGLGKSWCEVLSPVLAPQVGGTEVSECPQQRAWAKFSSCKARKHVSALQAGRHGTAALLQLKLQQIVAEGEYLLS